MTLTHRHRQVVAVARIRVTDNWSVPLSKSGGLTPVLTRVLSMTGDGYYQKQIDGELGVKGHAACNYQLALRKIFNVDRNSSLVKIAYAFGLSAALCLMALCGCASKPAATLPPMPPSKPIIKPLVSAAPIAPPAPQERTIPIWYPPDMTNYTWHLESSPNGKAWSPVGIPVASGFITNFAKGPASGTVTVHMPSNTPVFFWRLKGVRP